METRTQILKTIWEGMRRHWIPVDVVDAVEEARLLIAKEDAELVRLRLVAKAAEEFLEACRAQGSEVDAAPLSRALEGLNVGGIGKIQEG